MKAKLLTIGSLFILIFIFLFHPLISLAQTTIPSNPCPVTGKTDKGVDIHTCDTAIGQINATDAISLIGVVFKYVVSVAGIGAILLLLLGAYKIILSRGDKEKLHEARDTITSAILGLVFIILSLVILQIIGVSILQIPGFEQ